MKERTILDKICDGNLVVMDTPIYKTDKHKADEKELLDLRNRLEELLTEQARKLLDDYVTLSLTVGAYITQEQIKDGIVIGMILNDELEERKDKIVNSLF